MDFKPVVNGMLVSAFDGYFFKHLKSNAIVKRAKRSDAFVGARLLPHKIVGGKTENGNPVSILLV
jgi:hypothetical protein